MWCFQHMQTTGAEVRPGFVGYSSAFIPTGSLLSCWRQTLLEAAPLHKSHGPRREERLLVWADVRLAVECVEVELA